MSIVLNLVTGSGGPSATDAILRVIAPAGSTVTISRDGTTKVLKMVPIVGDSANKCYYIFIKQSQFSSTPWTLTATNGSSTETLNVVINASGEYSITITYELLLYNLGNEFSILTGGYSAFAPAWASSGNPQGCINNNDNLAVSISAASESWKNGAWGTANIVDFTGYSTLHIRATAASSAGNLSHYHKFGVTQIKGPSSGEYESYPVNDSSNPNADITVGDTALSVGSLTSGYIWFGGSARTTSTGSVDIVVNRIWMTKEAV